MHTVNIHEAKTNLSRLLEEVAAGQEVIIAKAGKPMARLVPLEAAPKPRRHASRSTRWANSEVVSSVSRLAALSMAAE